MQTRPSADGTVVLIIAPFGRDAQSIAEVIGSERINPVPCATPDMAAEQLDSRVGAIVLTEEALLGPQAQQLGVALEAQPTWSDIPVILLRAARSRLAGARAVPCSYPNLVEVERPVGASTLLSTVASALRSRLKQFVIRDQVERLRQSQETLAASEAELRLVADALPVLIAFVDTQCRYAFVNRAYEQWLGKPIDAITGQRLDVVLGPETWAHRRAFAERALSGEAVSFSTNWPTHTGERRECDIRYLPRRTAAGIVDGFHIFVADVTERTLALEAVQEQAAELEHKVAERTAELQAQVLARASTESALHQARKMESVGQLTGGIAHDFNNMLTGIISALDLIRMRVDAGRVDGLERWVDVASASAHRAAGLTQRLLAFSRRQSLNSQSLALNKLVASLDDLMRRTLGEKIRLTLALAQDVPRVRTDSNQLESAILNLTINARDAMPRGGDLSIRTHREVVESASGVAGSEGIASGCYAVVSVTDTGEGIPPDVIERIFEPFFTTKPIGQGTGLGMSMIYGFMQQSNGHVRVESEVGRGTTVSLYLPESVAEPVADAQGLEVTDTQETVARTGSGQQLLVVEDDAQVRTLVTEVLTELGYAVQVVDQGDAALAVLRSAWRVDALVTDVGLPGINGRQLAEIARQAQPALPVLFMTGYAEAALDQSEFLDEGMQMIGKPFSLNDFGDAVARLFQRAG
ncbi:ATP-binding protein [Xanthomonas sp. 60]